MDNHLKKFILLALCALLVLSVVSCRVRDAEGRELTVVYKDGKFHVDGGAVTQQELQAMLKGSVYETGEQVTVFGTCLDTKDRPVNGTSAKMSAWYPNGTVLFSNVSMSQIQTSYFIYTGPMNAVQGTYLTEILCSLNGSNQVARAFGEWQNPAWVARINATQSAVGTVLVQIGALNATMSNSFLITWSMLEAMNMTLMNISSELDYVAMVANGSVDRNDSLIVQLLYQLMGSINVTPNVTTLTVSGTGVQYTSARYLRPFGVIATANLSNGQRGTGSQVTCTYTSDNIPPSNEAMDYYAGVSDFRAAQSGYVSELTDDRFTADLNTLLANQKYGFWYHQEDVGKSPVSPLVFDVNCTT
jgi:hypothetical protein